LPSSAPAASRTHAAAAPTSPARCGQRGTTALPGSPPPPPSRARARTPRRSGPRRRARAPWLFSRRLGRGEIFDRTPTSYCFQREQRRTKVRQKPFCPSALPPALYIPATYPVPMAYGLAEQMHLFICMVLPPHHRAQQLRPAPILFPRIDVLADVLRSPLVLPRTSLLATLSAPPPPFSADNPPPPRRHPRCAPPTANQRDFS
jgi:hypothetical protein